MNKSDPAFLKSQSRCANELRAVVQVQSEETVLLNLAPASSLESRGGPRGNICWHRQAREANELV